ncbi:MAG: hypothetical protein LAP87_04245 [Acidobacteriia bacterium]|nr:hypothetical protein [Terriglobia bacterium]
MNRPCKLELAPIREAFLATGDAEIALAERTAQVDRGVAEAAADLLFPEVPAGLTVLAVGGYGRRQLFPYSDVDLLLLFASERLALARKDAIAAFLQRLWDAGMRVSHAVHTPAECAEIQDGNIEFNVSLLDQRYLAGDRSLYAGLVEKLPRFLEAGRDPLVRNLARLARERYAKFGNTFYHLEPNVKETPGGLRDYQLIGWLEQLRVPHRPGPGLHEAFRFLARLRCYLHCQAGRDHNVLSFDAQDALADDWREDNAARWMRRYYRHSRDIHRAALRALEEGEARYSNLYAQFREWRSRVSNTDFSVHREHAHFRAPQRLALEPGLVLHLFEFVARHGIRLSSEAAELIDSRLANLRDTFAEPQALWPALNQMFTLPHAPLAIRAMHETGVLTAVFPELEQMECLVVRDFYHRYTVDEHSLVAIENLWSVQGAYRDLLGEVKQPGALLLALLFHDVGKGSPGEGHIDASLRLAETAMRRIRMPAPERATVLYLIRKHLDLSAALQSRDVFDPQTIRDVAHQVETVERLKSLTLVTWADISAVNPGAMTPWRAAQLWQLYLAVYNELTRELETERIGELPSGPPERMAFLQGFPTRYLRTHSEGEIDEHMALEARSRERGAAVDIRRLESAWQLTLVTADRPGLFAAVAGTLSSFALNILRAEAFANRRGVVLDTFTFSDPLRTLDLNPAEVDRLHTTIERVIAGKTDVRALLRSRPKPTLPSRRAGIPPTVSFNAQASGTATLVEIVAADRPGLLYDLASAISSSGGNIEVVLIDTEGHKAIDVFYVTAGGKKLDAERQRALDEALRRALG